MAPPLKPRTAIYGRVSTLDQDPEMQLRELRACACHRRLPPTAEFVDHITRATTERPQRDWLWQAVRGQFEGFG